MITNCANSNSLFYQFKEKYCNCQPFLTSHSFPTFFLIFPIYFPLFPSRFSTKYCTLFLSVLFFFHSILLYSYLIVIAAFQALLSQFLFMICFIIPAFRHSYHSHQSIIHITKGGKSMNTSEKQTHSVSDNTFPANASDFRHAHGPVPYCLTNDYLFRAVLQQNNPALKGLICSLLHLPRKKSSAFPWGGLH